MPSFSILLQYRLNTIELKNVGYAENVSLGYCSTLAKELSELEGQARAQRSSDEGFLDFEKFFFSSVNRGGYCFPLGK